MMFTRKISRSLTKAEESALETVTKLLEEAFGKKMFSVSVNADNKNNKEVFGVSFAFDMRTE